MYNRLAHGGFPYFLNSGLFFVLVDAHFLSATNVQYIKKWGAVPGKQRQTLQVLQS